MEENNIMEIENEEIRQDKNEMTIEDYCYRYEEMKDSMEQSIFNINKVIDHQTDLINIVKNAIVDYEEDKKKEFETFVEGLKEQNENYQNQIGLLNVRIQLLTQILDECKQNPDAAKLISMLSVVLGLFEQ